VRIRKGIFEELKLRRKNRNKKESSRGKTSSKREELYEEGWKDLNC